MPQGSEPPTLKKRLIRWFSSQKGDYARLVREFKSFQIELTLLEGRTKEKLEPWLSAARAQLKQVSEFLSDENRDIEGGWVCLHAARRHAIYGLEKEELATQASILREEATKIVGWRTDAITKLLAVTQEPLTVDRLINAMYLRDEYYSNQYHKIWMVGAQLRLLIVSCILSLLLLAPLVVFYSESPSAPPPPWGYQMVAAVFFFGLLGAAFSAAGSLMNSKPNAKIPERVANQFVTSARALFGAALGIAGYAFYQSKILNICVGVGNGPADSIAVAFLFGFAGEMLIANVLGTLGGQR
jgi:hypothetical protein